jgi:hypothetical protein
MPPRPFRRPRQACVCKGEPRQARTTAPPSFFDRVGGSMRLHTHNIIPGRHGHQELRPWTLHCAHLSDSRGPLRFVPYGTPLAANLLSAEGGYRFSLRLRSRHALLLSFFQKKEDVPVSPDSRTLDPRNFVPGPFTALTVSTISTCYISSFAPKAQFRFSLLLSFF